MGVRFRKSINLGGGFRVNLSKSGIGYSWGIPGYRITKTANGRVRQTISIPGTGINYVEESKIKNVIRKRHPINIQEDIENIKIKSAPIENFQSVEYSEFIEGITHIEKSDRNHNYSMIGIGLCGMMTVFFGQPIIPILFFISLILKYLLYPKTKIKLEYTGDNSIMENYINIVDKLKQLNNCGGKWQINQYSNVSHPRRKYEAGASKLLNRIPFVIKNEVPSFLDTDIDIVQVCLSQEKLIFLPDKILIFKDDDIGVINYNNISIEIESSRFIENDYVPKDSEIIDYTWQYVNKNGSADRRFNNNRQLPICIYYDIYITSTEGLNIDLQVSNNVFAMEFVEAMKN